MAGRERQLLTVAENTGGALVSGNVRAARNIDRYQTDGCCAAVVVAVVGPV